MFFVREVKRGRGVADQSRDKTEVSHAWGWEEVVNAGRWLANVLEKMTLKGHNAWNPGKSD